MTLVGDEHSSSVWAARKADISTPGLEWTRHSG